MLKDFSKPIIEEGEIDKECLNEKVLDNIVLSDEKIDKNFLKLTSHDLKSGKELINGEYNTRVYSTDKRIMLVNAEKNRSPSLEIASNIIVSHNAKDNLRVFSIPTKHINGISLNMNHKASVFSVIQRKGFLWLLILGILTIIFSVIWWYQEIDISSRLLFVIPGVIAIIVALFLRSFKIGDPAVKYNEKTCIIYLSVIEPFYHQRSTLRLTVDTNIHDMQEIIGWINVLQQRCKNIV